MRPQGRMAAGYYPCPPQAIETILPRLKCSDPSHVCLLDPCAGEGAAIKQLADAIGVPHNKTWLVELDRLRGDACRTAMPEATVLAPASFLSSRVKRRSFSLVYCNPPFDDVAGMGLRVETQFLDKCESLLVPGGVLLFVCPRTTFDDMGFKRTLIRYFERINVVPWPQRLAAYKEVFILAERRRKWLALEDEDQLLKRGESRQGTFAEPGQSYDIPPAEGPGDVFEKLEYTAEEKLEVMAASPLHRMLTPPADPPLPRPPLALSTGHLALLLATGHLDGLVLAPGRQSHVVRGVARKVEEKSDQEIEKSATQTITKTTYTERIKLIVRMVGLDGVIRTLE